MKTSTQHYYLVDVNTNSTVCSTSSLAVCFIGCLKYLCIVQVHTIRSAMWNSLLGIACKSAFLPLFDKSPKDMVRKLFLLRHLVQRNILGDSRLEEFEEKNFYVQEWEYI